MLKNLIIQIFQKAETEIKWAAVQSLPLELAAVEATSGNSDPISNEVRDPSTKEIPQANRLRNGDQSEDLSKVTASWPQILEKMKDYNHSLISSLKLAQPVAIEGKELLVVFPYKFHKDAIEARKNRIIVDQVIEEVTGIKLMVKPVLQKDFSGEVLAAPKVEEGENSLVESALKILGGEIETP